MWASLARGGRCKLPNDATIGAFICLHWSRRTCGRGLRITRNEWIVVGDMIGTAKGARITLAAPLKAADAQLYGVLESIETAEFDPQKGRFVLGVRREWALLFLMSNPCQNLMRAWPGRVYLTTNLRASIRLGGKKRLYLLSPV